MVVVVGAKQGTRFLGTGVSMAALAVDTSSPATNMTANAQSITESPTSRYNLAYPLTLAARFPSTNATAGTIYAKGNGAGGLACRMRLVAGGNLQAQVGGVTVGALVLPGVGASSRTFVVAWISMLNPDRTGASDEVLSWLVAAQSATSVQRSLPFTHAVPTSSTDVAAWGADNAAGTNAYNGGQITMAGLHHRVQTLRELVQDWLSTAGAITSEFDTERQPLPFTRAQGLGNTDELHGPAAAWAAQNQRMLRRRLMSGLHVRYQPLVTLDYQTHLTDPKSRFAVGSATYLWRLGWLHVWPVPTGANSAWVELHLRSWITSGVTSVPVGLRVYSLNRLPGAEGSEPYAQYFVETIVTRNDTASGVGNHVLQARLPLAVGTEGIRRGKTYILVAYAIDPENARAIDNLSRIIVSDLHVSPGFRTPADGEIGFGFG